MKHIISIIICLIIITATTTAQVKFTQLERAATQWSLPVAKRVVPGISDYVMTYMTLAQLIDSTETILGTRIDSMKMTTNDTLALYTSDGVFKTKIVITEVDGDPTNELQELTIDEDNKLILSINNSNVDLTPYIDIDSTVVENDYGTIIVESPANTFGITVDSTKFMSIHAGSLKVGGSGTDNYIPRFNGTTAIENSIMYDSGTAIGIGTTSPGNLLSIHSSGSEQKIELNRSGGYHQSEITNYFDSFTNKGIRFGGNASYGQTTMPSVLTLNNYNNNSGGRLGIETDDPQSRLHLTVPYFASSNDGIRMDNSSVSVYQQINNDGDLIYRTTSGHMTIAPISTSIQSVNPSAALHLFAAGGVGSNDLIKLERTGGYGLSTIAQHYTAFNHYGMDILGTGGSSDYIMALNDANNRVAFNQISSAAARTVDINGELRVRDLTTDAATLIIGADSDGDFSSITPSYGLTLASNLLKADTSATGLATAYDITQLGDITAVTVSAPITGGGTSGSVNVGVDTTASTPSALATQHDISSKGTMSQWGYVVPSGTGGGVQSNITNNQVITFIEGSGITIARASGTNNVTISSSSAYDYWRISAAGGTPYAVTDDALIDFANGTGITWSRSGGVMTATNTAPNVNANLTFSGASSPYTLNSSDGTDVTFAAGTGISLSRSSNELTITNSSSGMTSWLLAASGTAGTQSITNGTTATITAGTSMTATRSSGNVTVGVASGGITTTQIADGTVALADIADIGNAGQVVGTITGSGSPVAISIGTGLQIQSSAITNLSSNYGYLFHSSGTIGGQSISTTPLTVNFNDQMQGLQMTCNTTSDYVQVTNSGGYEIDYGICVGGISSTRQISVQVYVGSSSVPGTLKRFFIDSGDEDCAHGKHLMDLTAGQQVFLKVATSGSETATFDGPQLKVTRIY